MTTPPLGVRFQSLTMDANPDADGDRFVVSDVEGLDAPIIDYKRTDHFGDGGMIDMLRVSRRELNIKGIAYGPSSQAGSIWRVRNKLEDAVAQTLTLALPVAANLWIDAISPGRSCLIFVRMGGKLHLPAPQAYAQPFELPLTAEDPRKYSQILHSFPLSGNTVFTNLGNYPTPIYATANASSGSTAPFLQNNTAGNARISFAAPVAAGVWLDTGTRRTGTGGLAQELTTRPRTWWQLLPGDNSVSVTGNWQIQWRDAWM